LSICPENTSANLGCKVNLRLHSSTWQHKLQSLQRSSDKGQPDPNIVGMKTEAKSRAES